MSTKGPVFPVAFDEMAMAEDLARLGEAGARALAELGREIERLGGLPRERLIAWRGAGSRRNSAGRLREDVCPVAGGTLRRRDGRGDPS
jgi:hypothetical protein